MSRIFITGSSDGLGLMAAQLLVEQGTPSSYMRATSNALKQRIANFLGPKPSSPAIYAWNQLGRKVKKGEHGIRILAPVIGVRRKKDEEAEKDIRTQNRAVLVGFRAAYVFERLSRDLRPRFCALG